MPYQAAYIDLVPPGHVVELLEAQCGALFQRWKSLPDAARGYRYASGKWSVEELILHVVDIERAFGYRAMCFLRALPEEQPGVDQDIMVPNSGANERSFESLALEFQHQRLANVELLRNVDAERWSLRGRASGAEITVGAIAHLLYGHAQHHAGVLERVGLPD